MKDRTVIAVFEDAAAAREVAEDLTREGVPANDIHIGDSGRVDANVPEEHRRGFVAWLEGLFNSSDSEPGEYKQALNEGKIVVAVDTDDAQENEVIEVMQQHGAMDLEEKGTSPTRETELREGPVRGTAVPESRTRAGRQMPVSEPRRNTGETRSIPVVREEVHVGKKPVVRGGVRVYAHVVEEPVDEQLRLREEKVRVERRPVNRAASGTGEELKPGQTIEMTETGEEPVITKEPRVVEEIVITKEATERTEPVHETARRTEVKVEPLGVAGSEVSSETSAEFRKHFDRTYATTGSYSDYSPAYEFGARKAAENRGQKFEAVESNLKTEYLRDHPAAKWDRVRDAVRYGWDRRSKNI